jgi:hypothetical protein
VAGVCAALIWLSLCTGALASAQTPGTVESADGTPLAGVLVARLPFIHMTTDADGRFVLERSVARVRFSRRGYRPTTLLASALPNPVVLERAANAAWTPPLCGPSSDGTALDVSGVMRFTLPRRTKITRGSGDHDEVAAVQHQGAWLRTGWGFHWSSGLPLDSEFRGLVSLEERDVILPWGDVVAEYRGRRADGSQWRFLGSFGVTVQYDTKKEEAAAYFDRIIDSLCWRHSGPPR